MSGQRRAHMHARRCWRGTGGDHFVQINKQSPGEIRIDGDGGQVRATVAVEISRDSTEADAWKAPLLGYIPDIAEFAIHNGHAEGAVLLECNSDFRKPIAIKISRAAREDERLVRCGGCVQIEDVSNSEVSAALVKGDIQSVEHLSIVFLVQAMGQQRVQPAIVVHIYRGTGEVPGHIRFENLREHEVASVVAVAEVERSIINGRLPRWVVADAGDEQVQSSISEEVASEHAGSKAAGNFRMLHRIYIEGLADGAHQVACAIAKPGSHGAGEDIHFAIVIDVADLNAVAAVAHGNGFAASEVAGAIVEIDDEKGIFESVSTAAHDVGNAVAVEVGSQAAKIENGGVNVHGCGKVSAAGVQHDGWMQSSRKQQVRPAIVIEVGGGHKFLSTRQGEGFSLKSGLGKNRAR